MALEVFYLFSELFETSQAAQSLSDFIKGKAVNACIACSDPPQQLRLFESVNLFCSDLFLPREEEQLLTGGEQLFYALK